MGDTTIRVSEETKKRLEFLGTKNETYDEIINQLISKVDTKEWMYQKFHDEAAKE